MASKIIKDKSFLTPPPASQARALRAGRLGNEKSNTSHFSRFTSSINWIFGIVFFTIGVLNVFLVHPAPSAFYILLSFIYFPPINRELKKRFSFSIPFAVKLIFGLIILWATLAVGDLMEIFEGWALNR